MFWIVPGLPQGIRVYVPGRDYLVNGKLDDAAASVLRQHGGNPVPHEWREPVISDQEIAERAAAMKANGTLPDDDGKVRADRDLAAMMKRLTKPMRPSELLAKRKRARMW